MRLGTYRLTRFDAMLGDPITRKRQEPVMANEAMVTFWS